MGAGVQGRARDDKLEVRAHGRSFLHEREQHVCVDPGCGFRVQGFGFRVSCFVFRVSGFGSRVWGVGFGV